jgi:MoxR-like ATPase
MKVLMGYPSKEEEREVVQRICAATAGRTPNPVITLEELASMRSLVKEIYIDEKIIRYIVDLVAATRCTQNADIAGMIEYGASPRASIGLAVASKAHAFLNKRSYVTPYDVKEVGCDVLRHRLVLSYEAEAQERSADFIIAKIFDMVEVP